MNTGLGKMYVTCAHPYPGREREQFPVVRTGVTKAVYGNYAIVVKRLQRLSDSRQHLMYNVQSI